MEAISWIYVLGGTALLGFGIFLIGYIPARIGRAYKKWEENQES